MKWLLDTNVLSYFATSPPELVQRRLDGLGDRQAGISTIVLGELSYGFQNNRSSARARLTVEFARRFHVAPFDQEAAFAYGRLRFQLRAAGIGLGANDLLIAAHAIALDATLVSADQAFENVPGLKFENWLR